MVNVWPKKATAVGSWLGFPKNGPKQVHQCKKTNKNDTDKKHPKCQHKKDTVTLSPFVLFVDVFPCFHPRELGFWGGFLGLWKIWRKKRVRSIQESKPPKVMERAKGQVHCEKAQRARLRSMVLYKSSVFPANFWWLYIYTSPIPPIRRTRNNCLMRCWLWFVAV